MDSVKIKKQEALEILTKNRAEHREIFLEAVDNYKKQAITQLQQHIKRIKNGTVMQVSVSLPVPVDYTKEYDRAIKMLQMSVDDVIEVQAHTFQAYIMDDWQWKRQFLSSNSTYSAKAMSMLSS